MREFVKNLSQADFILQMPGQRNDVAGPFLQAIYVQYATDGSAHFGSSQIGDRATIETAAQTARAGLDFLKNMIPPVVIQYMQFVVPQNWKPGDTLDYATAEEIAEDRVRRGL